MPKISVAMGIGSKVVALIGEYGNLTEREGVVIAWESGKDGYVFVDFGVDSSEDNPYGRCMHGVLRKHIIGCMPGAILEGMLLRRNFFQVLDQYYPESVDTFVRLRCERC
ncbi:hypothetical protein [Nocardia alni]|uniref:hypothetical protein n=1 Tax=Nocardia alni TaxID=2815723 RepID=UPI001C2484D6|nr:hypothetical protein [Nocardia alni]